MSAKMRLVVYGAIFCVSFAVGCQPRNSATLDRDMRTGTDIRKAEVLRELDRKWENPDAHYELGKLYHESADWSKAEWHYNIALGFKPSHRNAQAAIVKLQFDKGDNSKGDWAANNYMAQAASLPEQLLELGVAFEGQGLDNYALKCYQDALRIAPNLYTANRQLGYYYLARNNKDLAKDYFIRSFQLNPNQPDVAGELGRLGVAVRIPQAAPPVPRTPSQPLPPPAK